MNIVQTMHCVFMIERRGEQCAPASFVRRCRRPFFSSLSGRLSRLNGGFGGGPFLWPFVFVIRCRKKKTQHQNVYDYEHIAYNLFVLRINSNGLQ